MKKLTGYMKGVNLGGWFSQCKYSKERFENFITEADFPIISGWGVDHVRLPVDYNVFETPEGEYKEDGFAYVEKVLNWCGKYGLNLVLDLHKTYGFSFDNGEKEVGFFDNEDYQERFYRLWEEFARRFGDREERLCFELLNEVTDKEYSARWNAIARRCIERIRAIRPTIKILVGSYWNNSYSAVADLDAPYDENIVYNFHCYSPLVFTHQSAYWVTGMPEGFHIGYPMDADEYNRIVREQMPSLYGVLDQVEDPHMGSIYFEQIFAEAVKVAEERGVALYCGEYGVIEHADPEDTLRWYADINAAFEKLGIGRCAWSYREMDFDLCGEHLAPVIDRLTKLL